MQLSRPFHARALFSALGLCLGLGLSACGPNAEEQRLQQEQQAIVAYSEKVKHINELLGSFTQTWKEVNQREQDVSTFLTAMKTQVLPRYELIVTSLRDMPTQTVTLKAIHAPLLSSYERGAAAFKTFIEQANAENAEAEYGKLASEINLIEGAQQVYTQALETYYKEHKVVLLPAP